MNGKLAIVNQNVAGIDIGSREIFVALAERGSGLVKVRSFETFNADLDDCVGYLKGNGIESVCMEATGVYWVTLHDKLESAGMEVFVVNGAHARNLARRKSDVADCAWLYELHSHGLLRKSFIPERPIRKLRAYIRMREVLIQRRASNLLRAQKFLELMNLKFHLVLSQTLGRSGRNMIEAILEGERDPSVLVKLCSNKVAEPKREQIRKALEGNYQDEFLFGLAQAVDAWDFDTRQIRECDRELQATLEELTKGLEVVKPTSPGKAIRHNPPNITGLNGLLLTLNQGKDMSAVLGFNDMTVLKLVSFTGTDMSPWPDEKHFASWAGLAPRKLQSGSRWKRAHGKGHKEVHQIFRMVAQSLAKTKGALGDYYRGVKARRGSKIAIKALARKLACIYYRTMRYGTQYVENGIRNYEGQQNKRREESFIRQAKKMGLKPQIIREMLQNVAKDQIKTA